MYVHGSRGKGMRTVCSHVGSRTANFSPGATPSTLAQSTRSFPASVGCGSALGAAAAEGDAAAAAGVVVAAAGDGGGSSAGGGGPGGGGAAIEVE